MNTNKVRLIVLGFSFNQAQSATYGLVLSEEVGLRRLMVVVGAPEAQSIAFRLQNVVPPRPLTHDLFKPILDSFFIELQEIVIHKFSEGVFHSKLILKQGEYIVEVDSRTSDAVALALRNDAPIYTTEEIMQELAVLIDDSVLEDDRRDETEESVTTIKDFSLLNTEQLQDMLTDAVKEEDYELASLLRDEIGRKKQSGEEE